MVLIEPLTPEEIARHEKLLQQYSRAVLEVPNPTITLIGNGSEKGIYELATPKQKFVAAAATNRHPEKKLLAEYTVLHDLWDGAPTHFPRPIGHWSPPSAEELGDMFVMERIQGVDIDRFKKDGRIWQGFNRDLAEKLGYAIAAVNAKTGRYMTDPHDGNIMIEKEMGGTKYQLRFVDAIQWRRGDLEDAVRQILQNRADRPEAFRFINEFYRGVRRGLLEHEPRVEEGAEPVPRTEEEIRDMLAFMAEYNPIIDFDKT